ncbi:hypothetical protein BV22DRAFT_1038458 [Leucogyrophana mollusca]|uniref:Uncharacterized protein n=1 Tax=Leucogyrophana mollusca TaxID=85980 RepID=A0ACB8B7G8_9AGAM|nr:hypothetical protein BV22DRAFT_1038458 [Leucogyrophana mollusca]
MARSPGGCSLLPTTSTQETSSLPTQPSDLALSPISFIMFVSKVALALLAVAFASPARAVCGITDDVS